MLTYIHRFLLLLAVLASSQPVFAQPGCGGGVLADPRAYFFWSIQRAEGSPANDFADVMRRSGYPAAPGPNVRVPDGERFGITQWIDASGSPRGRLSLPTSLPDDLGYFTHTIQYIKDAANGAGLVWTWIDMGGPPYGPRACGAAPVPPVVVPPQPAPGPSPELLAALLNALQKLDSIEARLNQMESGMREQTDEVKASLLEISKRPFPCFSGRLAGFAPVTLCPK